MVCSEAAEDPRCSRLQAEVWKKLNLLTFILSFGQDGYGEFGPLAIKHEPVYLHYYGCLMGRANSDFGFFTKRLRGNLLKWKKSNGQKCDDNNNEHL